MKREISESQVPNDFSYRSPNNILVVKIWKSVMIWVRVLGG
jgi:hypothetical protein